MVELILMIAILSSFILSAVFIPRWIIKCKRIGLLWEDMNKMGHPQNVASSGGVVVVMSFILGVLFYIAIRTFIIQVNEIALNVFALLSVILIFAVVGLIDDLLGWKHGGLSAMFRVFLALMASIPLVVINAGTHFINTPFGPIQLGIIYPLVFIPLGIAGAAVTYNFLAGFNGLEAGQGIIILSFLSFVAYATGSSWLSVIGLCMVASLMVFYYYNRFPAKVFPGDIMTYSIGALIAGMAILGNFERVAVFVFIPYIIEMGLKIRGRLKMQSFGLPDNNGGLKLPYQKIYGLTHLSIFILSRFKKKVYEKDVVYLVFLFQIIICLIALMIFRESIFLGVLGSE
ncbi:glycosyl transferase family 4 [archaeon]|jgi:UDP-N-acetylglucosamine--dolichyl-phosphate N-acetylglucosaminephosphotransferase|nr:glycosyl transferase family 4 [archaeon]